MKRKRYETVVIALWCFVECFIFRVGLRPLMGHHMMRMESLSADQISYTSDNYKGIDRFTTRYFSRLVFTPKSLNVQRIDCVREESRRLSGFLPKTCWGESESRLDALSLDQQDPGIALSLAGEAPEKI